MSFFLFPTLKAVASKVSGGVAEILGYTFEETPDFKETFEAWPGSQEGPSGFIFASTADFSEDYESGW